MCPLLRVGVNNKSLSAVSISGYIVFIAFNVTACAVDSRTVMIFTQCPSFISPRLLLYLIDIRSLVGESAMAEPNCHEMGSLLSI